MYRVRLINKGVGPTSPQHPVCGISGKLYGQAVIDYARGGPVFEMSGEDYERDKFDIIGNMKSRQQWVPEFIEVPAPKAKRARKRAKKRTHGFADRARVTV